MYPEGTKAKAGSKHPTCATDETAIARYRRDAACSQPCLKIKLELNIAHKMFFINVFGHHSSFIFFNRLQRKINLI